MPTYDTRVKYPFFQKKWYVSDNSPSPTYNINVKEEQPVGPGIERLVQNSDPNWRVKIVKKQNASLNYSRNGYEYDIPAFRAVTIGKTGVHPLTSTNLCRWIGTMPASFPSVDIATADIALKRLKSKLSSHQGNFNAMLPLAELRELRVTISGSAELTSDFMRTLIDIKRTKGLSAAKYISKAWLTYGFGIAPMIADTKKLSESISDFLLRNDHTVALSGSFSKDWTSGSRQQGVISGAIGTSVSCHATINHKLSYQYKGGFNLALSSATNYNAFDHFGIRPESLIPTFWELMPFSWVADYFATVGDFLEDEFTGTPVKLLYLNETRKYEATGTNRISHVLDTPATVNILDQKPSEVNWRYFEFQRTVLSALPHRVLRLKTVDEVAKNSLNKLSNLMAVFMSFKRH